MRNNRRTLHRGRRIPKQSRTLPLRSEGEDDGKYYRCWNCGFICKDGRDSLGDDNTPDGTVLTDSLNAVTGRPYNAHSIEISRVTVLPIAQSDGTAREVTHRFAVSGNGCPLCHTQNWKGDY